MSKILQDCVAIITGAGHGLGEAYALALAEQGAMVVLCDNGYNSNGESLAYHVADKINRSGGRAMGYAISVTQYIEVQQMVDDVMRRFGKVDVLIHSAGISISKSLEAYSTDEREAVMSVHLDAAFHLLTLIIPHMKKNGYGRIVLVSSTVGMFGLKENTVYAAAKMGIWGLARSVSKEVEGKGVLCNAIAPLAITGEQSYTNDTDYNSRYTVQRVAPFVVALCSRRMKVGGRIYQIAGGNISRIEICEGKGVTLSDTDMDVDTILEKMDIADSMSESIVVPSLEYAGKILFKKVRKSG